MYFDRHFNMDWINKEIILALEAGGDKEEIPEFVKENLPLRRLGSHSDLPWPEFKLPLFLEQKTQSFPHLNNFRFLTKSTPLIHQQTKNKTSENT